LSDENVFIQVFKIVWNLGNLGQNLGKILENLQQGNLGIGQIFSSEAEQSLEILGIWEILEILESFCKIMDSDKSSAVRLNKILES
jgi:hypothetical protein